MNPELKVAFSKKGKKLTFAFKEMDDLVVEVEDGEINIVALDEWITAILKAEWERHNLRQQLSGK